MPSTAAPTVDSTSSRTELAPSYPWFDYLRFVLAAAVCLSHQGLTGALPIGNFAVQVFFALSGWLIGGVLLRTSAQALPRFFYNRVTRIWAPYLAAVAALYGLAFTVGRAGDWQRFLLYDLTFTHNWFVGPASTSSGTMPLEGTGAHFWSIAVEEQFYLVAPLIIVFCRGGRRPVAWAIVAATMTALAPGYFAAISLGVLAAVVRSRRGAWHQSRIGTTTCAIFGLAGTVIAFAHEAAYSSVAPIAAVAVVLLLARPGARTGLGVFVGGISYPFYLNHWMGLFTGNLLINRLEVPVPLGQATAFAAGVSAGICAYLIVDRPVLRRRKTVCSKRTGKLCMLMSYALLIGGLVAGLALAPNDFPNVEPGAIR